MATKELSHTLLSKIYEHGNNVPVVQLFGMVSVSPSGMLSFVDKYRSNGILSISDDNFLKLTETGIKYYNNNIKRPVRTTPTYLELELMCGKKIEIGEPYIPNRTSFLINKVESEDHKEIRD